MVTVKERTIKGKTYLYVSSSVSYKGHKKRFEKSIGPKDSDERIIERKKQFYSRIIELKVLFYRIYLQAKEINLQYLPQNQAFILVFIPETYRRFLSQLYPGELEKYQQEFDVRYVYNTTAIEGNTLSLKETALVIDDGIAPKSKKLREIHEVENYTRVLKYVRSYHKEISFKFMKKLHELIQRNIDDNTAGSFRKIPIGIVGSSWTPTPPIFIEEELQALLVWYQEQSKTLHPFELAGIFHHRFLQLHPFADGNGRVARELLNLILRKYGFPPLVIPVAEREEYMKNLQEADDNNIQPLLEFFLKQLINDYVEVCLSYIRRFNQEIIAAVGQLNDDERAEFQNLYLWVVQLIPL